jgi:hypothetical protein
LAYEAKDIAAFADYVAGGVQVAAAVTVEDKT